MVKKAKKNNVQLATFIADITPTIGGNIKSIEHPLFAKGFLLRNTQEIYVLCALDWCYIANHTYDLFRQEIAAAVGTTPARVALQCVHQHGTVCMDHSTQDLLDKAPQTPNMPPPSTLGNRTFPREVIGRIVTAIRKSATQWQKVTHAGTSWAPVNQVASTRRVLLPDGTIHTRYSRGGKNPMNRDSPEGKIDGFIRTISLYKGMSPLVNMHYYATHPVTMYGDGRVSYDIAGIARERLQKKTGVFQIYFDACGGDSAPGKYNDGSFQSRAILAERLYNGMAASLAKTNRFPIPSIKWKTETVRIAPRSDKSFSESACRKTLNNPKESNYKRVMAACYLVFAKRFKTGRHFEISCLSIGSIRVIHLPGEPFAEYQLWAQRTFPNLSIAMAGYGDCSMFYLCTDQAYAQKGGHEVNETFAAPCEKILKRAIGRVIS